MRTGMQSDSGLIQYHPVHSASQGWAGSVDSLLEERFGTGWAECSHSHTGDSITLYHSIPAYHLFMTPFGQLSIVVIVRLHLFMLFNNGCRLFMPSTAITL